MKLVRFKEISATYGDRRSRVTNWRKVQQGKYPKPIKVGPFNYWTDEILDTYYAALASGHSEEDATQITERSRRDLQEVA